MAAPAKTSFPSSSSIPCRTNPCMKNSETSDPMRRSFSGNPFAKPSIVTNPRAFNPNTPANSPSDFPRTHSTGRETVASLHDSDKENSKDQNPKPTRVRSPAPSKGTRNFMSPTISAASKINASPRKKILVEKNEPVRSSVSFSDVKSLIMEDNQSIPEIGLKQKKVSFSDVKSVIMEDESTPEIGLNQKKVSFSDVKSIITEGNEPTPQENVDVSRDLSSSNHEYEAETMRSNPDFDYKKSKNDSDSLVEAINDENDSVNVDPSFKISPRVSISPSCPVLAPLDADPSMPPYDPKTNYLSPRPQFLHYRPNPRIDLYREREGKQLDQHFASVSYSDTDVSEETQSEGSQREPEDISSEETMEEGEDEVEEEQLHLSEESVEAERMSKPRFSTRSKFIVFLLVLAFAYLTIQGAHSPIFAPSGFEELSLSNFQVPSEVTDFAKAHFDRFSENLQHWSASFLSYASNIISSSREVHKLGPFRYSNLSYSLEDHMSEGHQLFGHSVLEPVRKSDFEADKAVNEDDEQELEEPDDHQESEAYRNLEIDFEEEFDEVQHGVEFAAQIDAEHVRDVNLNNQPSIMPQATENQLDISKSGEAKGDDFNDISETLFPTEEVKSESEMIEQDHLEADDKEVAFAAQIDAEYQSNVNLIDQSSMMPQATEIQHDEISKSENPKGDDDMNNNAETMFPKEEVKSDNPKIEASHDNSQSSEAMDSPFYGPGDNFPAKNVMGLSLLVLCLLAAIAFIYTKRGKPSMPNAAAVPGEQPPVPAKKSEYSPVSVSSKDASRERLSSRNWQTEVDMANESCPSEMSSCQRTSSLPSSHNKMGLKESNEHQSQETKTRRSYRRESLASSDHSTNSSSYGSFTTYQKLPNKHGGGEDEEIVTPVRRSSRIRKQVTSP